MDTFFEWLLSLFAFLVALVLVAGVISEFRESDRVDYNLSQEADNFNVVRQLTVFNCIEGDVLFQMTGKMSIKVDSSKNQLEVIVEKEDGSYVKHFIGLSDNVSYVVEDLGSSDVSKYHYEININPNFWIPVEPVYID